MRLSVIISTYNQPQWLELSLLGFVAQRVQPSEILIADDGSDDRTAAVIARVQSRTATPIRHVWHEDAGFRKSRILNEATKASSGDALFFTDGDCIPRADLIGVVLENMRPGRFLSGGYIKLPEETSRAIDADAVLNGNATDFSWLRAHGAPPTRPLLRLRSHGMAAHILDIVTPTRASLNGHNATVWRDDVMAANGFNEDMGYGGQDRELGERLSNARIHGIQVRHRAHLVHLHHGRGYIDEAVLKNNRAIRDDTVRNRRLRTANGIVKE